MSEEHNYTASDAFDAVTDKLNTVISTLACVAGSCRPGEESDLVDSARLLYVMCDQMEKLQEVHNALDSMAVGSKPTEQVGGAS